MLSLATGFLSAVLLKHDATGVDAGDGSTAGTGSKGYTAVTRVGTHVGKTYITPI